MSQSAKKIFLNLLWVAILSYSVLIGAVAYSVVNQRGNVLLFTEEVLPDQRVAELALQTGIEFKWQVQDWKNVLLRSTGADSLATSWMAFEKDEDEVKALVTQLKQSSRDLVERALIDQFSHQHLMLGEQYRAALLDFKNSKFDPRLADQIVRGADRPALELLTRISSEAVNRAHATARNAEVSSQNTLMWSVIGIGIGLTLSAIMFYLLVRRTVLIPTEQVFDDLGNAEQRVQERSDELEQAMTQLMQSEKLAALGNVVAGVAHELNTPIGNALLSATSLNNATGKMRVQVTGHSLNRRDLEQFLASVEEGTGIVSRSLERAAALVRSFKSVAVNETSEARMDFDLRQVLDDCVTLLAPGMKHRPIQITLDCATGIACNSYPGALTQIISNLVENAARHGLEPIGGGEITVHAHSDGGQDRDWVTLRVVDHGAGIAPEHLQRIFEPFFTTRLGQGGSGLGLHVVHRLANGSLGGGIEVQSHIGKGTTFELHFPRRAPRGPA
jgi:signal transduction histidine kinase